MGNFRTIILDFETIGNITTIKLGTRTDRAQSTEEKGRSVREKL
jgi:uncharacterized protein YqgV (UPF0045/DUF77 family)